jgi:uncharacterized membrane protein HdeD (DUF308 family)
MDRARASTALYVALGLILVIEAVLTLRHALSVHHDQHLALVAVTQGIGALLFIWPRTMRIGACLLVCLFLISAVVHAFRGEFASEHLVSAIAVSFIMLTRPRSA